MKLDSRKRYSLHSTLQAGQVYGLYQQAEGPGAALIDDACYRFYMTRLFNCLHAFRVQLHAYGLMPREAFLLLTSLTPHGCQRLLKTVNAAYGDYFRQRFQRARNPWSRLAQVSPIHRDCLVLDCQKFIERIHIDLGIREAPGLSDCSSYLAHAFGGGHEFLTPHSSFQKWIENPATDLPGYRKFVLTPFRKSYRDYLDHRLRSGRRIGRPAPFQSCNSDVQRQGTLSFPTK